MKQRTLFHPPPPAPSMAPPWNIQLPCDWLVTHCWQERWRSIRMYYKNWLPDAQVKKKMFEKVKKSVLYCRAPSSCLQTKENPNFQTLGQLQNSSQRSFSSPWTAWMHTIRNSGGGTHSSGLLPLRKRCSVWLRDVCFTFCRVMRVKLGSEERSTEVPSSSCSYSSAVVEIYRRWRTRVWAIGFFQQVPLLALTALSELGCGIRDLQIVHFSSPALWLNLSGHFHEYSFILALSHALYFQLRSLWLEFIWQRPGCSLLRGSV